MHNLFKRVTLWGLASIIAVGLVASPNTARQVDAKGGYDANSSQMANDIKPSINAADSVTIIAKSETWKYFAKQKAPNNKWVRVNFKDSAWLSGAAPLGYGNTGEATTLNYGKNPAKKYVSAYFRKLFDIENPALIESLTLELVHSDGAAVYLNGKLVAQPNMPAGKLKYKTRPTVCGASVVDTITLDPKLLTVGKNVLAVEVHNCKPDAASMTFDASLTASIGSTLRVPTLPAPAAGSTALVGNAETWQFWAKSSGPAETWMNNGFDASTWLTGAASLGYGNTVQTTKVSYGTDASKKFITTYFRKEFNVSNAAAVKALTLNLVHDDGAVVYLNGKVIAHPHMGTAAPFYSKLAIACDNGESNTVQVSPALLVEGKNVLAVEVHQCSPSSLNMIFNANLVGSVDGTSPTAAPTKNPTAVPTKNPTAAPTKNPTAVPTKNPTAVPTKNPTAVPTKNPTAVPTKNPTVAPTSNPGTSLPAAPNGQKWSLRWSDDFTGTAVDTSKWKINNLTRSEDPNKTWYHPNNVTVSDGTLKLKVKKESMNGANYTGGMLESTGSYRRNRYGYYEARIKYNLVGPGFWTNFWMCGVDRWPPEIDNEVVTHRQGMIYLANHYRDSAGTHKSTNTYATVDYNQWHTYGVLWLPGQPVKFYIDGNLAFTANSPAENPPNIDMYLSLRAGAYYNSTWGGTPNSTTQYPGIAEYDFVKVYEAVN